VCKIAGHTGRLVIQIEVCEREASPAQIRPGGIGVRHLSQVDDEPVGRIFDFSAKEDPAVRDMGWPLDPCIGHSKVNGTARGHDGWCDYERRDEDTAPTGVTRAR